MKTHLLDKGYVEFIEAWGTGKAGITLGHDVDRDDYDFEVGIIEAARQSTQGTFRGWSTDELLLRSLYTNDPKHATPFEFAGMVIEVQAPIAVFREWHRHRTQSYNEMSARYAPLPEGNYVPDLEIVRERCQLAAETKNKQLQGATPQNGAPDDLAIKSWLKGLMLCYEMIEKQYQFGLEIGIPKELARLPMAVAHYSRMRASANLRNWLSFMTLRDQPGVMWETRQYAQAVGAILLDYFPRTWQLFCDERGKRSG